MHGWVTREDTNAHLKWVVNLSSRPLSDAEKAVLSEGRNFSPAPTRIPPAEVVAAVDSGLMRVPEEQAELVRTRITGALSKVRPPHVNLLPTEHSAIKSLQKNDHILVLPADKGREKVVMDKLQYEK